MREEPGNFIPLMQVGEMLREEAYGVANLVELGLFHSDHCVRAAIQDGKLKGKRIHKRAIVICRQDLIDYWRKYRNKPYECANNTLQVKITISDADSIANAVTLGQKKVDKSFSKDDYIRNLIQYIKAEDPTPDSHPELFIKHTY